MTRDNNFMRFQRYLTICLVIFLVGCHSPNLVNLNEGIASFQVQNYRDAFIRLTPEAKKGNRDAQYAIGYMYYYGQGVVEDRKKAWYWINCAANAGQADAIAAIKILSH